jgi:pimeloyl-ACP methyl ester carboxylesterase
MYLVRGGSRGTGDAAPPGSDKGHPAGGPSAGLLLTEPIRGLADLAALLLAAPGLAAAPRGDGHGVLVFPGLLAGDSSTVPLRAFLRWLGYDVRGWDLGRNHGPSEAVLAGLPRAVLDHAMRTGRPVSLVGWSLGGIYAREMARRHPRQVRQVITLGSPYAMHDPRQNHAHGPYQRLSFLHAPSRKLPTPEQRSRPVDVPTTSVRRARDGVARQCRGPLQPRRLRRGPGDALADRRPAGRTGRPASPVPPAAGAAPAVPRPPMSGPR